MIRCSLIVIWLLSWSVAFADQDESSQFFTLLSALKFDSARQIANQENDSRLRFEMLQLTKLQFYEGQIAKDTFKISTYENGNILLSVVSTLNKGYVNLYYDRVKGNAYRPFYDAFQLAKADGNPILIQACLVALLKYYNSEVGQNTQHHLPYLKQLESLQGNTTDRFWVAIYKMIFFTQSFQEADDEYFKLSSLLDEFEQTLEPGTPLLTYLFYEKALQHEIKGEVSDAAKYYNKTIDQSRDYPFLRYYRFNGKLKLMLIEISKGEFNNARRLLAEARREIDIADSLRSDYSLNLNAYVLAKAEHKYDTANNFLFTAMRQQFQLGFTSNSLEIARLNVELQTQETENANLGLRENRIWLLTALLVVALLFLATYFAYANQRTKNRIQEKEKEMQSMKMEKLLKDQEIFGIDAMLEGQERERQKIADDLHDNLGSLLTTVKFNFQSLIKKKEGAEQELLLQKTDGLLEEAYQKVRSIAHASNAGVNAKDGLLPSVRNFVSKVSTFNQLSIAVEEFGMDERLDNTLEIMIFRMIQELITNVIKHAQATEVTIHLTKHEGVINLMVEDNGIGFENSHVKPEQTMGLYSIQKKIENLGGRVTIDSIPKSGTTIIIDIPLT